MPSAKCLDCASCVGRCRPEHKGSDRSEFVCCLMADCFHISSSFHGIQASLGPSVWKQRRALRTLHDHRPLLCHKISGHARSSVATETETSTNKFWFWACDRTKPPYQHLPSGHQRWHPCLRPRSRNPAIIRFMQIKKGAFWIATLPLLKTDLFCTKSCNPEFLSCVNMDNSKYMNRRKWFLAQIFLPHLLFGILWEPSILELGLRFHKKLHPFPWRTKFISMFLSIFDSNLATASWTPHLDHSYANALRSSRRRMWQNLHTAHFPETKIGQWQWFNFNDAFQCVVTASGAMDLSSVLQFKRLAASLRAEESNDRTDWTISRIQNCSCSAPAARASARTGISQPNSKCSQKIAQAHRTWKRNVVSKIAQGWHHWFVFACFHILGVSCMIFCMWELEFRSEQFRSLTKITINDNWPWLFSQNARLRCQTSNKVGFGPKTKSSFMVWVAQFCSLP